MHSKRFWRLHLLALALALGAASPPASAQQPAEYEIKAAFLLNFARLAQWPDTAFANAEEPLTIAVFADDPFQGALESVIRRETVRGRSLRARRIEKAEEVRESHLLFVPASQGGRLAELRAQLEGVPVLLVGESPRFAARGGSINLFQEEGRIRFEVNRQAAERAGVKLSSRLLRLARLVDPEDG